MPKLKAFLLHFNGSLSKNNYIIGDFNESKDSLQTTMTAIHFTHALTCPVTTDYMTQINHFNRKTDIQIFGTTYQSLVSDHKPIWAHLSS